MAILIDSSVLIGLERRGKDPDELETVTDEESFALASITASEILVGVHRADSSQRRQRRQKWVEDALGRFLVLPLDLSVARLHAQLWAQLSASGAMIGLHDIQVAATALAHDYAVLTDNVRDFERVPGLVVRQPHLPRRGTLLLSHDHRTRHRSAAHHRNLVRASRAHSLLALRQRSSRSRGLGA
jgi:predicted nucleic acid-binding protein